MKNIWIVANWKSNKNISEALEWLDKVGPNLKASENLKIVVCPPFIDVEEVKVAVKVGGFPILVGVQDLSPYGSGAHTGEEAASLLKDIVDLAILGHSERRESFSETDEMVQEKVSQAVEYNIIPLVCVQNEDTPIPNGTNLIAFEPVESIGTGNADSPEDADSVASKLKQKHGGALEVLYGGSVTSENAKEFIEKDNISGLLVGKSSLDPDEFLRIVDQVS